MLSSKLLCFVLASVVVCLVSADGNGEGIRSDDVRSPILRALRAKRSPLPDPHRHKVKGVLLVQPVAVAVPVQPTYTSGCNVCGGSGYHTGHKHKGVVGYGGLGGYGGYGGLGGGSFSQSSSQASSQASSFGGFGGSGSQSSAQSSSHSFGG